MSFNNPPLQGKPPANALGLQSVQQIEREARSNQIVPSDDIMVRRTTKGTLLSLRKKSSGGVGAHDHAASATQADPCLVTAEVTGIKSKGLAFSVQWPVYPVATREQGTFQQGYWSGIGSGHTATVVSPPISRLKMQHKNWGEPWPDDAEFYKSTWYGDGPPWANWPDPHYIGRIDAPKTASYGQWVLSGMPHSFGAGRTKIVQVLLFPVGYGGLFYRNENMESLVAGGFLYPSEEYSWNWVP